MCIDGQLLCKCNLFLFGSREFLQHYMTYLTEIQIKLKKIFSSVYKLHSGEISTKQIFKKNT